MKKFFDNIQLVRLTESLDGGYKYRCIIIKPGITSSANTYAIHEGKKVAVKKNYPKKILKEAAESGMFEGVSMILRSESDHLSRKNQDVESVVGYFTETKWNNTKNQVEGIFNLKKDKGFANAFRDHLKKLWETTKNIGLSITGFGEWVIEKIQGEYVATVTSLESITSVDPCRVGNAGGRIISLVESELTINHSNNQNKNKMNFKQKLFAFLSAAGKIADDKKDSDYTEDQLTELCSIRDIKDFNQLNPTMAMKIDGEDVIPPDPPANNDPPSNDPPPAKDPPAGDPPADAEALKKGLEKVNEMVAEASFRKILSESKLNQKAKDLIEARYKKQKYAHNERDLRHELSEQAKLLSEAEKSGWNSGISSGFVSGFQSPKLGMEQDDKYQLGLEWLLSNAAIRSKFTDAEKKAFQEAGVTGLFSFKEFYKELTGDYNISGKEGKGKLAESIISTTYTELLGNAMHRSVIRAYKMSAYQMDWRKICSIVPRTDFKENTLVYEGGYANLPTVAEAGPYTAATTPGEEAQKYKVTKKGYTEDITREAIRNDDLRAFQKLPFRMGEAAARTIYEFVFNLILSNPTMLYDTTALFHANHNNLITNALDATGLEAGSQKMFNQVDLTNGKILGYMPKYLLVPRALGKVAYNLTTPAYGVNNQVPEWVQTWAIEPIIVAHQTSQVDWHLVGDPLRGVPTIEIGFLDGREEPEIFIQDQPTTGNVFTNDKITFKIRHEYNGAVENHRGFVEADV